MAELDYAFLADFAAVQDGKLTAVGASYTRVVATDLPMMHNLFVAGRVRVPTGVTSVPMTLQLHGPDDALDVSMAGALTVDPDAFSYQGRVGVLFAITVSMPLLAPGLHTVDLIIDGVQARHLAFTAEHG